MGWLVAIAKASSSAWFRRVIGGGVLAGLALAVWAGAHTVAPAQAAVTLYDQLNNATGYTTSQDFEPAIDAYDSFLADDFVVPGGGWTITGVDVEGQYFSGSSGPVASFNVFFYANSGTLPGALVTSVTGVTYTHVGQVFSLNVGSVALPAGTYWVSVQARMDFTPAGQWGWTNRTVTSNNPAAWQNPGNGFSTGCSSWVPRASSCNVGSDAPDQAFRLIGTATALTGDLSITKTDNSLSEVPGTPVTYTITASNAGPATATGATVTDNFPAHITGVNWTCIASAGSSCPASGMGNISAPVTLLSGGTATFTATGNVSPTATGTLSNAASIAAPSGFTDSNSANDQWVDDDVLTYQGDVSITKTNGVTSVVPGTQVTYTVTASNAGPSAALSASVIDNFPATITDVTWTCIASVGSTCTGSGNGNINETVLLLPSGTATFTASGTVSPHAQGTHTNHAQITPPAGFTDSDSENNGADDIDTLTPRGDVSITKTDGAASETPGTSVTYTIVASNTGPSTAAGATVTDSFPGTITGVTWSCVASTGSTCAASGNGNINESVTLIPSGTATFTASGTISASASGSLANTAAIAGPTDFDSTPANNSATDTDTLTTQANLGVDKSCPAGPVLPGEQFTCTITVSNAGPSDAQTVSVSDNLPDNVTLVGTPTGAGYTCGTGDPFACTRPTLAAAASTTISVTVRVKDDAPGGSVLTNAVTVTSATPDSDSANNSDSATTTLPVCSAGLDRTNATGPQTIRGTAGDDVICGSAFGDSIQGMGGNDIIFGNGGNDSIQGTDGNDKLFGGTGDDTISGPPGIDAANGGAGYDRCISRTNTACEVAQIA